MTLNELNLSTLSLEQLLALQKDVATHVDAKRSEAHARAVAEARALIDQYGLTEGDVFPKPGTRKSAAGVERAKVAPKYRDPATGMTWTGRGKPPKWIENADRNQYLITSDIAL